MSAVLLPVSNSPMARPRVKNSGTDIEVLDASRYLARDVVAHPLVVNPKPMGFNVTFKAQGVTELGWDNPESAPWRELATYVRKLAILEDDSTARSACSPTQRPQSS